MYDFDLVSIGTGPAGQRAAVQAAKLGKRAAVVEKRRCVGGVCIATGTIPSKTMREAVIMYSGIAGKGDRLPWARVDGRPSCAQLFAGVDRVIAREIEVIEDQLRRNDVVVLPGEAAFADPHTLVIGSEQGSRRISAANIVIAVGTDHRESRRLLGIHCIGTGATELVHVGQAVLALGAGLDYFLGTVFNYPTFAECYKVAALDASNKLRA